MTAFSVLNSFLRASEKSDNKNKKDDSDESQAGAGESSLLTPTIEQVVSAPYNFSFA